MAKGKQQAFLLEKSQKDIIDELTDEEAGVIFKAIYEYENTKNVPDLDRTLSIVFKQFKIKLDMYDASYEDKCQKNSESAKKRWEQIKESENMQMNANACERIQTDAFDTNINKKNKNKININKIKSNNNINNNNIGSVCVYSNDEEDAIASTHPTHTDTIFSYASQVFTKLNDSDLRKSCDKFFKYYQDVGWNKVKNWKSKVELWVNTDYDEGKIKDKKVKRYL